MCRLKIHLNLCDESDESYFLEADVQYPQKLHDLYFLPERMKIEKVEKFVANLYHKKEYLICIKKIKQALNHGLVLKKMHKGINFNQKAWLKPYIDMKTELRKIFQKIKK